MNTLERTYHRSYSTRLRRDMELLTFGHAGPVVVAFPASMGAFFDYEDRGMVAALSAKIEAGLMRLACASTVDKETFHGHASPRERIDRYLAWEHYLLEEAGAFVQTWTGGAAVGLTGCGFGAYHALTLALRHPDVFTSCIAMGGTFDITRRLDGYYDTDAYLLCPPHFLPALSDPWYLDRISRNKWVLATGERDPSRAETEQMSALFAAKGIPHSLHVWSGEGADADWPSWRRMADAYVP